MRKIVVIATALATALSAISPTAGWAQSVSALSVPGGATIDPIVAATFEAFPNGGQELTDRIRGLILQNNEFAGDVARYLQLHPELSAAQREAAERGVCEALSRLGLYAQCGSGDGGGSGDNSQLLLIIAGLAAAGGLGALLLAQHKTVSPN